VLEIDIAAGQGSVRAEGISAGALMAFTCGMRCELHFDEGSSAKLTVFPGTGWLLESWDGACSGAEGCSIRIAGRQVVAARFKQPPQNALLVSITWGEGSIRAEGISAGAPSTATCNGMRNTCHVQFDEGSIAKLTAEPGPGWLMESWHGDCSGAEGCSIRIGGLKQATASFKRPVDPKPPLDIVFDALDVSQLDGPNSVTYAQELDDTGAIAGTICDAPVRYGMACDLFLWDGALHRIHVPDGFTAGVAATAGGRVAGAIQTASGALSAFVTRGRDIIELPTLGGRSFASAVNASGVVVGGSFTPSGETHAVLWRDGVLEDLGARTGKAESMAMAIDENGKVGVLACDRLWLSPRSGCRAMVMTDGAPIDLGALPDGLYAYAMSAAGQVVGSMPLAFWSPAIVAAVWSTGETKDLEAEIAARPWPTLGAREGSHFESKLRAVAPSGAAVGDIVVPNSEGGAASAILWKDGTLVDLARAVDPPTPLHSAFAVNAKWQILAQRGEYVVAGGLVLLTPR
jgi:probable HAF family extracellular repeat protein